MFSFDFLKKSLELVLPPLFLHNFPRKIFSRYILLTDQISFSNCFLFLRMLGKHVEVIKKIDDATSHQSKIKKVKFLAIS